MDLARTATSVIGNCLATVVARLGGEFNDKGNDIIEPIEAAAVNLH